MSAPQAPSSLTRVPDPFDAEELAGQLPELDLDALPPAPTRAEARTVRRAALALAAFVVTAIVLRSGLRADLLLDALLVVVGVLVPIATSAAIVAFVARPAPRSRAVVGVAIAASLLFVVASFATAGSGDTSLGGVLGCFAATSMLAFGPALALLFSARNAFATGAGPRTGALGLAGGLVGAAGSRLHCPNDAWLHVLAGHGGVALALASLGAVLATRVTRA